MENRKIIERLNHEVSELLKENTELKKTIEKYRQIVEGRSQSVFEFPKVIQEPEFEKGMRSSVTDDEVAMVSPPPPPPPLSLPPTTTRREPKITTPKKTPQRQPSKGQTTFFFDPEEQRRRLKKTPPPEEKRSREPQSKSSSSSSFFDSIYNAMVGRREFINPKEPESEPEKNTDFDAKYTSHRRSSLKSAKRVRTPRKIGFSKRF